MNKKKFTIALLLAVMLFSLAFAFIPFHNPTKYQKGTKNYPYIRINQIGYHENQRKFAYVMSNLDLSDKPLLLYREGMKISEYKLSNPKTGYGFNNIYAVDFSDVKERGTYHFEYDSINSHEFKIGNDSILLNISADALNFIWINQAGKAVDGWHKAAHLDDGIVANGKDAGNYRNMSGGFYDAGDYLKFTKTTAETMFWLLIPQVLLDGNEFQTFLNSPHGKVFSDPIGNTYSQILSWGMLWLSKTFDDDQIVVMVGNETDHYQGTRMPQDDKLKNRPIMMTETGYGGNIAALLSAVYSMAQISNVSTGLDNMKTAIDLYNFAKNNTRVQNALDFYVEHTANDELTLAAILLYQMTGTNEYLTEAMGWNELYWNETSSGIRTDWMSYAILFGDYFIAKELQDNEQKKTVFENIFWTLTWNYKMSQNDAFNYPFDYYFWSSVPSTNYISVATALLMDLNLFQDSEYDFSKLFVNSMDYVFGANPWDYSFVTGYGVNYPHTHHHQMAYVLGKEIIGALSLGPANIAELESRDLIYPVEDLELFQSPNATYYPNFETYVNNEPTIYTNAQLFFSSFLQCLLLNSL